MFQQGNSGRGGSKKKWLCVAVAVVLGTGTAIETASAAEAKPQVTIKRLHGSAALLTASNLDPNSAVTVDATMDGTTDDSATDDTATDDSATDDTATDDSATDDTATDDTATDDTATDDSATDDSATDDSATDDSATDDTTTSVTTTPVTESTQAPAASDKSQKNHRSTAKHGSKSKHQGKRHHGKSSKKVHRQGHTTARSDKHGRVVVKITLPQGFNGDLSAIVDSLKRGSHHTSKCSKHMSDSDKSGETSDNSTATMDPSTTPTDDTATDDTATDDTTTTTEVTTTTQPTTATTEVPTTTKPMTTTSTTAAPKSSGGSGLADPVKKDIAMQIVSSNENSSVDWKAQYGYIEYNVEGNASENRGYTAGLIGFCTKCGDLSDLVDHYTSLEPNNVLSKYTSALHSLAQSESSAETGLGDAFVADWKTAAKDPVFQQAQMDQLDKVYFDPAVDQAKQDGVGTLGQFIYYDAMVMHGPGSDSLSFGGIRTAAMAKAKTPAQGGDETTYLNAFLDARKAAMLAEEGHQDTTRVDTEQRVWLKAGNLNLSTPLTWSVYGESFNIK